MPQNTLDAWLERIGDRINPILVKETRQALKSRQFSITFMLLLGASLLVSFAGVAIGGPHLHYRSAGGGFFVSYFAVLAFAIFVVVPFGAYRSLASEQEERTFELLSISTLRPRQIVAGKLLTAIIQMFIYYSAIAPFMAFTILLKGIDVPSIAFILFLSLLGSVGLSMIGLFLATLARRRSWQVFLSVLIIAGLLFTTGLSIELAGESVYSGMSANMRESGFWLAMATVLTIYATYFVVAFELSAAQLTFEADNRSTRVRMALAVQSLLVYGWIAYWWLTPGRDFPPYLTAMIALACTHWGLVGAFLIAGQPGLSRRVARQVPRSPVGRACSALLFPGPGSGLAFLLVNLVCLIALVGLCEWADTLLPRASPVMFRGPRMGGKFPTLLAVALASYVFLYVALGSLIVRAIRRVRSLPAIGAAAVTLIPPVVGCLVPTFFALVLPWHQFKDYQVWQISDPIATAIQIYDLASFGWSLTCLPVGMAALMFLLNLRLMAQAVSEIAAAGQRPLSEPVAVAAQDTEVAAPLPAVTEPAAGV